MAEGLTNAEVAQRLFLSPRTVNAHLNSIYHKLGAGSRSAAVRFAVEHGLVWPSYLLGISPRSLISPQLSRCPSPKIGIPIKVVLTMWLPKGVCHHVLDDGATTGGRPRTKGGSARCGACATINGRGGSPAGIMWTQG
ncbi:MAG: LuxR C-terminal-related transcriptional regulator [Actinomycetota bacterium]|nr:LuxR C-terminal-related transcriptional regulator [Actinomycetota bacterium]